MKITIRKTTNQNIIKDLHKRTFPTDEYYEHENNLFWLVTIHYETREPEHVGFAILTPWENSICFLSRAGLLEKVRGKGLHQKLIKRRISYAKKLNLSALITYTSIENVQSSRNLLKCGFELFRPEVAWVGNWFNYWLFTIK